MHPESDSETSSSNTTTPTTTIEGGIAWANISRNEIPLVESGQDSNDGSIYRLRTKLLRKKSSSGGCAYQSSSFKQFHGLKFHVFEEVDMNGSEKKLNSMTTVCWSFACIIDMSVKEIHAKRFLEKLADLTEPLRVDDPDWRKGDRLVAQSTFEPILTQRMEQASMDIKNEVEEEDCEAESEVNRKEMLSGIVWSTITRNETVLIETGEDNYDGAVVRLGVKLLKKKSRGFEFQRSALKGLRGLKIQVNEESPQRRKGSLSSSCKAIVWVFACVFDSSMDEGRVESFLKKLVDLTEPLREECEVWRKGEYMAAQASFAPILFQRMTDAAVDGRIGDGEVRCPTSSSSLLKRGKGKESVGMEDKVILQSWQVKSGGQAAGADAVAGASSSPQINDTENCHPKENSSRRRRRRRRRMSWSEPSVLQVENPTMGPTEERQLPKLKRQSTDGEKTDAPRRRLSLTSIVPSLNRKKNASSSENANNSNGVQVWRQNQMMNLQVADSNRLVSPVNNPVDMDVRRARNEPFAADPAVE